MDPGEPETRTGDIVRLTAAGPTTTGTLMLPADDHITLAVERTGQYYEIELLTAVRERASGGTFVDVGAHYGNHSVFFALECGAERLVAVEPNPAAFAGLVRNLELNGIRQARPLPIAIHPEWRRVDVSTPAWEPDGDNAATSNTGMARIHNAPTAGGIDAATLDDVLADETRITLVKVDVEGNALAVVESGRRVIERERPLLVVEALSDEEQSRLVDMLSPLGYDAAGPYSWTPTYIWEA